MVAPQASVQRRILARLLQGTQRNIAGLARELSVSRPAASRALRALVDAGLAIHEGRSWSIAPAGRAELGKHSTANAATLRSALERTMGSQQAISQALGATFGRLDLGAFDAAESFAKNVPSILDRTSPLLEMLESQTMPSILDRTSPLLEMLESQAFGDARATALSDLTMQVAALSQPSEWWSPIVANSLSLSSQIAGDLAAISNAGGALIRMKGAARLEMVVERVLDAHHVHLSSALQDLLTGPPTPVVASTITTPTRTTARFTRVARDVVVPAEPVAATALMEAPVMALATDLEAMGARYTARDLRDAWNVVNRRNPGWSKGGAHLIREVVRGALDELAPPDRVPKDAKGFVTKRTQILWIVGGNETLAAWVDITTSNVGKLHSLLSAEAKNSGRPRIGEQGLLGLLQVAMGVVSLLVEQAAERRS